MPLSHINPHQYQDLLKAKVERIQEQFAVFDIGELVVFPSPPEHFRVRAEFRIWHDDNSSYYAMFKSGEAKIPHRIDTFPIGSLLIQQLMPAVMSAVMQSELLRKRLFQIEFLTTLSGQALITMVYHKPLDLAWTQAAKALEDTLGIHIIGRSHKQKCVISQDYVIETLTIAGQQYQFQQIENSFTQPNATINQSMLTWALKNTSNLSDDLLELYCGNGNFTVVLAQNFSRILATEISKTSVRSALYNFNLNSIENIDVVRMSSEELTSALNGDRAFRRLENIDLKRFKFSTILVDPPRAGLDPATEQLASRFNSIIYISCNPDTLQHNLQTISRTHRVKCFALFDQFPYTHHIECGVILERR